MKKRKMLMAMLLAGAMALSTAACSQPAAEKTETEKTTEKETAKETETKEEKVVDVGFSEETGDQLKITTLSENTNTGHEEIQAEFGFSVLIEKGDKKIVFDTAKEGRFMENASQLGEDVSDSDTMVLSHAHYDHCGGVMKYYDSYCADGKSLYVKDCFFDDSDRKYYIDLVGTKLDFTDGTPGYFSLSLDFTEADLKEKGVDIKYLDSDATEIAEGITVYGNFKRVPLDPKMVIKTDDDKYMIDDFDEEIAVAVDTSKGLVIVTGCSHTGIVNIVNSIKERSGKDVYAVIGGFHLLDASEKQIEDCIANAKELNIKHLGLSHCTGETAKNMFLKEMPENTFINATGSVFEMK